MHRFAPQPQRKLPSHLNLSMDDELQYSLITPPPTSHLLTVRPSTPVTESTTPLASPSEISDFMSFMNSTNYLQHVIANRIQFAQFESGQPSDEEGGGNDMATLAAAYDPLLGSDEHHNGHHYYHHHQQQHNNNLYLSPFAYDQVSGPPAMFKHRRADSQSSSKIESSGDESLKRKRSLQDDLEEELDTAEVKRQTHIQSEQKRRAQIKDGFEELRQQLPLSNLSSKKMSKATILINTVIYLQQIKASHQALTQELEKVQKENEQLRSLHGNMFSGA